VINLALGTLLARVILALSVQEVRSTLLAAWISMKSFVKWLGFSPHVPIVPKVIIVPQEVRRLLLVPLGLILIQN
jgi:hypothetical protein